MARAPTRPIEFARKPSWECVHTGVFVNSTIACFDLISPVPVARDLRSVVFTTQVFRHKR